MIDSWEDSQSKSRYRFLVVPILLLAVAGSIVIVNNSDFLGSNDKGKTSQKEEKSETGDAAKGNADKSVIEDEAATKLKGAGADLDKNVGKLDQKISKSVSVSRIRCKLNEKSAGEILISLRLYYKNDSQKENILYKQDEIKITVQKIMMKKRLEDINVDHLRDELRKEIDSLLGINILDDLEFTDFRPINLL